MALGDELRADDDVERAVRDGGQFLPQTLGTAREIARQDDAALVREERRDLFGDAFDAGAAGHERVHRPAGDAGLGPAFDMAAMMADERAPEAVLDEPGGAVGTLVAVRAGPAQRERRIAAPVEKEERLLAARERVLHGEHEGRRQPASRHHRLSLEVDGADVRQGAAAEALGQIEPGVASALGIDARLDGGRRRGEDHWATLETPAHHGHVAGVVVDAVLLLVGGLVLLVDDDEAEVPIG